MESKLCVTTSSSLQLISRSVGQVHAISKDVGVDFDLDLVLEFIMYLFCSEFIALLIIILLYFLTSYYFLFRFIISHRSNGIESRRNRRMSRCISCI